ncbi:MAG: hypothetical protein ABW168_22825 [Sedimenticola sp.]
MAGRVYGPSVTEALRKIGKVDHISEVMQTNSSYKQLNAGWADYTVSYPAEVPFQLNSIEMKKNDLRYFPIHGMEGIVLGYFGCSKRKLGKKVIEAVNDLIDQSGSEPPWRAYYRRWLNEITGNNWGQIHVKSNFLFVITPAYRPTYFIRF